MADELSTLATEIAAHIKTRLKVNGQLPAGADLNDYKSTNIWNTRVGAQPTNSPFTTDQWTLEVIELGGGYVAQRGTNSNGVTVARGWNLLKWSEWEVQSGALPLPSGTDLNAIQAPGKYTITGAVASTITNVPDGYSKLASHLEVTKLGELWRTQTLKDANGVTTERVKRDGNTYLAWRRTDAGGVVIPTTTATGLRSRTPFESTGEWTTAAEQAAYLTALSSHRAVTKILVGKTVRNADIEGVVIGDASLPAVYLQGTVHGSEMGSREGLMQYARELAADESFKLLDMCVVIVPTVNVDMLNIAYNNSNNVNIGGDFEAKTQPETNAVVSLTTQYNFVAAMDMHSFGYPRQVSLNHPDETDPVSLAAKSSYDAVFAGHEAAGIPVRRYGDAGNPGSMWRQFTSAFGVPTILHETFSRQPTSDEYARMPRHFEAFAAMNGARSLVDHVHENLADYVALGA